MAHCVAREREANEVFVRFAQALVTGCDVADLARELVDRAAHVLSVGAAGLMITGRGERLQLLASSSDVARLLELFQLQSDEGPCLECLRAGSPVFADDVVNTATRWPRFARAAIAAGYRSVHAVPLRLKDTVVGALNFFDRSPRALAASDVALAQAFADLATMGIVQDRRAALIEQLQGALDSRIVIEQAKGVVAASGEVPMDIAFAALRRQARASQRPLSEIAGDVVAGRLTSRAVLAAVEATDPKTGRAG
jgi:GAF domain-containing protein